MENQIKGAAERWGLNRCEEIYLHPTKAVLSAESAVRPCYFENRREHIPAQIRASDADEAVRQA